MPNRNLTVEELKLANELLSEIRLRIKHLAAEDTALFFAYWRKLMKELSYDERGKPGVRKKLKALKWGEQNRKCAHCGDEMELSYSELDRRQAIAGYTSDNTELVHAKCHQARQAANRYA